MKRKLQKKKIRILSAVFLAFMLLVAGCGNGENMEETYNSQKQKKVQNAEKEKLVAFSKMEEQKKVDENLKKELDQGYSMDEPLVVLDPYGNSPLCAVILFSTDHETKITVEVKGKSDKDNVVQTFEAETDHMIPVFGLYADTENRVILTSENGQKKELTIKTDPLSFDPGEIEINIEETGEYQYKQFTFLSSSSRGIYAVDSQGDIRWYRDGVGIPFQFLKNGHVLYCADSTLYGSYYKSGFLEADLLGKIYREYSIPGGMHHDVYEMENGNFLVASSAVDFSTVEDRIVEIEKTTGNVIYELDMKDLIDRENGGSINQTETDWFHNNGIWYIEEKDLILLSARHVDGIVGINKTEKSLAFILGDPDGWNNMDPSLFFTPVGEDFEWQYAQHQVSVRPDGTILMFDNGAGRTKRTKMEQEVKGDQVYSRAVAYQVNLDDMTIEQVFEYGKERGKEWYSEWISGVTCLDEKSDHLLVTSGAHLTDKETGNCDYGPVDSLNKNLEKSSMITEIKDGKQIFELNIHSFSTSSLTYRSTRHSLYQNQKEHDWEEEGIYLGSLGVTEEADVSIDLNQLSRKEMPKEWTLSYDPVRLTLSGSYELEEGENEARDAYLILENKSEKMYYKIGQNVSNQIVNMNGWVSPEGLKGKNYSITIVIGDICYETGKEITF